MKVSESEQWRKPRMGILYGTVVLTAGAFFALSGELFLEQSQWARWSPLNEIQAEHAEEIGHAMEISMNHGKKEIQIEGYLFDKERPTMTAQKTVILKNEGTEEYFKLPTMLVERRDLTAQYGGRVKDNLPDWLLTFCQQGGADSAQFPYNGAGFATRIPLEKLGGERYHIFLLDGDNGQQHLIDTNQEVAE